LHPRRSCEPTNHIFCLHGDYEVGYIPRFSSLMYWLVSKRLGRQASHLTRTSSAHQFCFAGPLVATDSSNKFLNHKGISKSYCLSLSQFQSYRMVYKIMTGLALDPKFSASVRYVGVASPRYRIFRGSEVLASSRNKYRRSFAQKDLVAHTHGNVFVSRA
jgi:hypothetical protein